MYVLRLSIRELVVNVSEIFEKRNSKDLDSKVCFKCSLPIIITAGWLQFERVIAELFNRATATFFQNSQT